MKKLNLILFLVIFSLKSNQIDELLKQYPNIYDGIPKEYLTDEVKNLVNERAGICKFVIELAKNCYCDNKKTKEIKDFITSMFTAPECLNDPYFITENVSGECSNLREKSSVEFLKNNNNISSQILLLNEFAIFNLNIVTNKDGIYTKHIWRLGFFEFLYNQSKSNKQN
jgi:hypothetical protein